MRVSGSCLTFGIPLQAWVLSEWKVKGTLDKRCADTYCSAIALSLSLTSED